MMMVEQVIDMVATKLGKPVEEVCVCVCGGGSGWAGEWVGVYVWVCVAYK